MNGYIYTHVCILSRPSLSDSFYYFRDTLPSVRIAGRCKKSRVKCEINQI